MQLHTVSVYPPIHRSRQLSYRYQILWSVVRLHAKSKFIYRVFIQVPNDVAQKKKRLVYSSSLLLLWLTRRARGKIKERASYYLHIIVGYFRKKHTTSSESMLDDSQLDSQLYNLCENSCQITELLSFGMKVATSSRPKVAQLLSFEMKVANSSY